MFLEPRKCFIKDGRSSGEGNGWLPTPVFLPGEFHGQRSVAVHRAAESDTAEWPKLNSLEHSSLFKERIIHWTIFLYE